MYKLKHSSTGVKILFFVCIALLIGMAVVAVSALLKAFGVI